jgi:DNA-binding response OmpR family regulator
MDDSVLMRSPAPDVLMLCAVADTWSHATSLVGQNLRVLQTSDIGSARAALGEAALKLVLIADDLREARGLTVLRCFVSHWRGPSVLLEQRDDTAEAVVALEGGFDDVWPRTIDPRLALARARALIRQPPRPAAPLPCALSAYGLELDQDRRTLRRGDREVILSRRERDVMTLLLRARGRLLDRHNAVAPYEPHNPIPPESLDAAVMRLRRRLRELGAAEVALLTVRGEGFLLRSNT